jgi:hypothetical protein
MRGNDTNNWIEAPNFSADGKPNYFSGIKRVPYEAIFGTATKAGI